MNVDFKFWIIKTYLGLLRFVCGGSLRGKGGFPPPRKLGELPPGKFVYLEREGTFVKQ